MESFYCYLHSQPKSPLIEAIAALYEAFGQCNFTSLQDLRDVIDQRAYWRFKDYSKGKKTFGTLDDVKAVSMDTFLKAVENRGYHVEEDLKTDVIDFNYLNNLSYDWFVCLYQMRILGWETHENPINEGALGRSVGETTFNTIDEIRNYLDRAAYGIFENSEYDTYEQEPYGSLENIQEVGMDEFVKDMSDMGHDVQSLVGQPIDDSTLDKLVYDWFVCLHTRGAVGWQYNWN